MNEGFLSFRLTDDFIDQYRTREVDWGFNAGGGNTLGEITYISKYSRKKADGTKERWYETCRRVIEGMYSIQKDHIKSMKLPWNEAQGQRSAKEAYERMFSFKWLPPGRGIEHMGTYVVNGMQNSAALQNCFSGDQKFITKEYGTVSFAEVLGETVHVVGAKEWQEAEVRTFGFQQVQRVTLAPAHIDGRRYRSNHRVDLTVTPDHRWILADETETTELKVGDLIPSNTMLVDDSSVQELDTYKDGLAHGLIFGDGVKITHTYNNGDHGFELRICDDRVKNLLESDKQLKSKFNIINYDRPSANGDPICYKRSAENLKEYPVDKSSSYIAGFLYGWVQADASRAGDTWKLATQRTDAYAWLRDNAATGGFVLTGANIDSVTETNFGPRKNVCWRFSLRLESLWKVESITPLEETVQVYCAVVPGEGAFTLSDGIYTGNCAFISTEKISSRSVHDAVTPFARLMEMSMLGVGVGFDVNGAGKLEIHEPTNEIEVHVVEDSREGWVNSYAALLESYFFANRPTLEFDVSQVRPQGAPIKTFGGIAPGPGPLLELYQAVRELFAGRGGQTITETDIADLNNLAGRCVVSGGRRRTAEIALGPADSKEFLNLKNYELNPNRADWGWASNNSIVMEVGDVIEDYIIERIRDNGEPGLIYLDLCRQYGRLIDQPNNRDARVMGTNPCSEQSLESFEMCTLVETFPFRHSSLDDFKRTLKFAYLYAKSVTLLPTHWPETNAIMQRNRRIGCSVSGVVQFVENYGWTDLRTWLNEGYKEVFSWDHTYSEWLGVRESIKTTSVKPSGTVSLLAGATPGVHWPVMDSYIRRMRLSVGDPMVKALTKAGYHVEPDVTNPEYTVVVELPIIGPQVRTETEVSVWEKANLAILAQRYWSDNQVSVTLSFRDDERQDIDSLLRSTEGQLKSVSFLPIKPQGAFAQMPYEAITEESYNEKINGIKKVNWDLVYDSADSAEAEGEKFCTNDVCEIKF